MRIRSVDIMRGAVMVLMAIDHIRVYSGIPAGGPDPGVFFTRWVTHFCAPAFVFFAGTSAYFYGKKVADHSRLIRFLISRGILLVILEMTLLRFLWAFHVNFSEFMLAGVIWMIGWCLILLAPMIRLGPKLLGILGLIIIFCQEAFKLIPDLVPVSMRTSFGYFWEFIYPSGLESPGVSILYVLVPWIGVMCAGYSFGLILEFDEQRRKKVLFIIGLSATVIFIVVGSWMAILHPENQPEFIFRLLNQRKYPASPLYLLMTLGPIILCMPLVENVKGWRSKALITFGRVPFFYYIMHILVIHLSALAVNLMLFGSVHHEWYLFAPFASVPEEFRWSLPLLYLIFVVDVPILYIICRWYARYKSDHPEKKWLAYI
jgi:uncharacterized membrane protein